jgi:predicted MFS family arabinose efflux permease
MNLGWSVGTFLGGILSHYDYKLLFYVDGCTSIFAGLIMLTLKFKTTEIHKNHSEEAKEEISPLKNQPFVYFILGTLLYTFCFFQLFTNVPLFYKVGLKLDEQIIGIVMSLNGLLIVMIEMVLVNNIEGKFSKKSIIVTGTLLMVLFYFLNSGMNLMNAFLIAFGGMLIITFGEILSLPFMNSYYLKFARKTNTGKYASIYMMTWSIGQILAGYIGGMIINSFGFPPLWLVCTGLSLLCAFIYFKVIK